MTSSIRSTITVMAPNSNNHDDGLVDKLSGALAFLRHNRDDDYRQKELAVERLRLIKDECEALAKTVRGMQDKLRELQQTASSVEAQQEMEQLQKEVERLNRETQFQHTELLAKKEKVAMLQKQIGENAKDQEAALLAIREECRVRREKMAEVLAALTPEKQVDMFQKELNEASENKDRLWPKWPRLVEQTASSVVMEASDIHHSNMTLRKLISGYKQKLGETESAQQSVEAAGQ